MNHLKYFAQVSEAKVKDVEKKITDYCKKFSAKITELSELIAKAKKDEVWAIEPDSTYETAYEINSISIDKAILSVKYKEVYGKKKEETDKVNLAKDELNNYDEAKQLFSWVKRSISKGYREDKKTKKKEEKENSK